MGRTDDDLVSIGRSVRARSPVLGEWSLGRVPGDSRATDIAAATPTPPEPSPLRRSTPPTLSAKVGVGIDYVSEWDPRFG